MRTGSLRVLAFITALAGMAARADAQTDAPRSGAARPVADVAAATTGATVSGTVRDSTSRAPFRDAVVQLSSIDRDARFTRAARSDSVGRYRIDGVPPGRYALGFLHPRLDSLGLQASVRELTVAGTRAVRLDLFSPSAALLTRTYCGGGRPKGAIVIGVVRNASDRAPVPHAEVVGEWLEFVMRRERLDRQQPAIYARTGEDGGYAICGAPTQGSIFISANRGADTTDRIELNAERASVLRRDLYIGPVRTVLTPDSVPFDDSVPAPMRKRRSGDGVLRGTVRTVEGTALAGALVRIVDGPQTRANDRGEWVLSGVPNGTRVLEVRAIGYYPESQPVDVFDGAPAVRTSLWTFEAVLDTVRVTAASGADRSNGGFARRSRSNGGGTFLTPPQVRARGGTTTTDVFRSMNGVTVSGVGLLRAIYVRGAFGWCRPDFYIDGLNMSQLDEGELDIIVSRDAITGIEVYSQETTPAQFQRGMGGCGAIVIWTRPAVQRRRSR